MPTVLGRFCRKKPLGAAGGALMLLMVFTAVLAGPLSTHDPIATDAGHTLAPPGTRHWLGSDHLTQHRFGHGTQDSIDFAHAEQVGTRLRDHVANGGLQLH